MGTMQHAHDSTPKILEVRHLRLVQAIAAQASVTRAASVLHLSQSAVSHQLVDLERDLGTRLFDRVGKKMVLTAAGARMLAASERLLRELSALERDMQASRRDELVPLRVTTSCYTAYHWLPAAFEHFAKKHPRIELSIVLEATKRPMEALVADEVDLAITTHPPREETWAQAELAKSELVLVARKDHPVAARGTHARWYDLRHQVVLLHDITEQNTTMLQAAVRESWLKKSGERLAEPATLRRIPLTEAMIELARGGTGVALADRWLVEGYVDRGLVMLPMVPKASRSFHAVYRRTNPRELPIDELVRVIARAAGRCAT